LQQRSFGVEDQCRLLLLRQSDMASQLESQGKVVDGEL
jgi:hypothetical protein